MKIGRINDRAIKRIGSWILSLGLIGGAYCLSSVITAILVNANEPIEFSNDDGTITIGEPIPLTVSDDALTNEQGRKIAKERIESLLSPLRKGEITQETIDSVKQIPSISDFLINDVVLDFIQSETEKGKASYVVYGNATNLCIATTDSTITTIGYTGSSDSIVERKQFHANSDYAEIAASGYAKGYGLYQRTLTALADKPSDTKELAESIILESFQREESGTITEKDTTVTIVDANGVATSYDCANMNTESLRKVLDEASHNDKRPGQVIAENRELFQQITNCPSEEVGAIDVYRIDTPKIEYNNTQEPFVVPYEAPPAKAMQLTNNKA